MTETELEPVEESPRAFHFEWIFPILFRPKKTLREINHQTKGVWIVPLLLLTVMIILRAVVSGPVLRSNLVTISPEDSPNYEYLSDEEKMQLQESQTSQGGNLFMVVFPAITGVLGAWISWLIFGAILHLGLTIAGTRSNTGSALNLVAWTSVPFAVRELVQMIAVLVTQKAIAGNGLSGFIAADAQGAQVFLRSLLAFVDIYMIWQVVLLLLSATPEIKTQRARAWSAVIIAVIIFLAVLALPGFIGAQLSGLSTGGMFF